MAKFIDRTITVYERNDTAEPQPFPSYMADSIYAQAMSGKDIDVAFAQTQGSVTALLGFIIPRHAIAQVQATKTVTDVDPERDDNCRG